MSDGIDITAYSQAKKATGSSKSNAEKIDNIEKTLEEVASKVVDINPDKWKSGNVTVFGERGFGEVYEESQRLNLNTITIPVIVEADDEHDSEPTIRERSWTQTKDICIGMKEKGYNVILEPFPYVASGTIIETEWAPTDMDLWFTTWKNVLLELGAFAETAKLDAIYIASNLVHMEDHPNKWANTITELRQVYSGKLIYRTNWWMNATWAPELEVAYQSKLNNPIFGQVDVIAIAAYFELTDTPHPTREELRDSLYNVSYHGRGQNIFEEIKAFNTKWGKPIFFGELGIAPFSESAKQPWSNYKGNQEDSDTIQSNWFGAWYDVFGAHDWFLGYSIFTIATTTSHYRVIDRPVEKVIKFQDFGGNSNRISDIEARLNALEDRI